MRRDGGGFGAGVGEGGASVVPPSHPLPLDVSGVAVAGAALGVRPHRCWGVLKVPLGLGPLATPSVLVVAFGAEYQVTTLGKISFFTKFFTKAGTIVLSNELLTLI